MVQIIQPSPRAMQAGQIGQQIAQGIARHFVPPEQQVQRGLLQEAFNKLRGSEGQDFLSQLESIAPTLMTTPGGAEALSQIAPILSAKAKSTAQQQAIMKRRGGEIPSQGQPQIGATTPLERSITQGAKQEQQLPESDVDTKIGQPYTKKELFPKGDEPNYPDPSAGPQLQRILSPPELENYALDLMQASSDMGTPMDFNSAMQIAQKQNDNIKDYNTTVQADMESRKQNIAELNADVVNRATNSGLIKSDDDEAKTVAEKLGYEARMSNTPAERWEYVRNGLRDFNAARQKIRREAENPDPFTKFGRKLMGTYKDKETVIKNLQPSLDVYRKYGLFDEARVLLKDELGFGPEDTETAIFPFSKEQSKELDTFKSNLVKPKVTPTPFAESFPGEMYNMPEKEFQSFKEDLSKFMEKSKDINLVAMRGVLNQNKKYSWQDISKAVNELIEEKRFTPNPQQNVQLGIINAAPLPGMMFIFKNLWTGAK